MSTLVERTLELAQEMKIAMGGRTSDPVNPNFLTAAAAIALHEANETAYDATMTSAVDEAAASKIMADAVTDAYRSGYGDAFRWVLSNIDLSDADREKLEATLA